jgi:hypothetical protein
MKNKCPRTIKIACKEQNKKDGCPFMKFVAATLGVSLSVIKSIICMFITDFIMNANTSKVVMPMFK